MIRKKIESSKKSILLLGPRQVGKSTFIRSLKPDLSINLADVQTLLNFSSQPSLIHDTIERRSPKTIFIDEVQKLPSLLNTIQTIMDENKRLKFFLTGSSARKLKRGGANLLPGRVIHYTMGPVTYAELGYPAYHPNHLRFGFLPEVLTTHQESDQRELLLSYSSTYLKEEILSEALTKSLESFSRFLVESTGLVGQFIDYSKLSARTKISRHTCPNYFEILEDTLIAYRILPRKDLLEVADLVKHPKFYFFDVGIYNGLVRNFELSSDRLGYLSEQLVFSQLVHSAHAQAKIFEINSFRTRGGTEVDFIFRLENRDFALEVKHTDHLNESDFRGLVDLKKYLPKAHPMIIHLGKKEFKMKNIWALPVPSALKEIGL